MFYKNGKFFYLEPRPKNANCPHCKSTETFVSLYKESRYCNNCDRTYTRADEIRIMQKRDDKKLHMRFSITWNTLNPQKGWLKAKHASFHILNGLFIVRTRKSRIKKSQFRKNRIKLSNKSDKPSIIKMEALIYMCYAQAYWLIRKISSSLELGAQDHLD